MKLKDGCQSSDDCQRSPTRLYKSRRRLLRTNLSCQVSDWPVLKSPEVREDSSKVVSVRRGSLMAGEVPARIVGDSRRSVESPT